MKKSKSSRAFVWIILGLLFVGLAGFGATNFGGTIRSVATVGDVEIDVNDYGRALRQELQALAQTTGQSMPLSQAQAFGLDRAVLARLIGTAALENETQTLGLSVGDRNVANQVTELAAFQGIDGKFDRETYQFALENIGLSVAEFEDRVRADTARNILQSAVVSGLAAAPVYTDTLYAWARERRDITWALLGPDILLQEVPEPDEETLRTYHQDNAARFTLPETRVATYAWLTPTMLLETTEIAEDRLREAYEDRRDVYVQPERRLVERLVFGTEAEAQAAKDRIDAGEATFDDLVAERDLTLDDVDQGDVTRADLDDAGDGVFALEDTGVAGPLPSSLGPALYRVNAILSATETSFEEARDELRAELASDSARRAIDARIGDFEDLLAGGATLEELAEETEMELGQIAFRPDAYEGIAAYDEFRDAVLVAQEGDFPELYGIDQGGVFALRLDEIRAPALQPFEEVRDEVRAAWEAAETERLLTEQAGETATAIEGGAEMAAFDLPLRVARDLTRDSFLEDAPAQMVENIFQMSEGDVRVFRAEGGAAIVRLDAITAADQNAPEALALKQQFAQGANEAVAADALQMFTNAVQLKAGINVNQQALNAVHAQFP